MKKFKISIIAVMALMMGIAGSAFTSDPKSANENADLYFYEYVSSSTAQKDIQDINNYRRNNVTCDNGTHVCGVFLPTDNGANQKPVASEFNAQKANLWASEQAGTSADPGIIDMRN